MAKKLPDAEEFYHPRARNVPADANGRDAKNERCVRLTW